jgi:LacI family transcriptional regulator
VTQKTRTPLKQIAAEAGVSSALVSMILHGKGRASSAVREQVEQLLRRAGYQPRLRVAPVLLVLDLKMVASAGKSLCVLRQIEGLQDALAAEGVATQIETISVPEDADRLDHLRAIARRKCGGIVVCTDFPDLAETLDVLAEGAWPVVQMGYDTEDPRYPAAVVDSFAGTYSTVRMLIEKGHRRIGTIRWQAGLASINSNKKHAGFLAALADGGLAPRQADVQTLSATQDERDWTPAADLLEPMLAQADPPTALLVENSFVSLSLLYPSWGRARPPAVEALEIVHFEDWPLEPVDDVLSGKLRYPPAEAILVTIPWRQVGQMAGRLMVERLQGQADASPMTLRISPQLQRMRGRQRTNLYDLKEKDGES